MAGDRAHVIGSYLTHADVKYGQEMLQRTAGAFAEHDVEEVQRLRLLPDVYLWA